MLACTKDSLDVVQILVRGGAGLHLVNKDGWTPLHIACRHGNANIVRFLLDTDPQCGNTVSKNGRMPLHTAGITAQGKPHPLMSSLPVQLSMGTWRQCSCCINTAPRLLTQQTAVVSAPSWMLPVVIT